MGRKKHAEEHENLERWLVSYADFITLLFATFVILYALSQIDLAKFKELKTSIRDAFRSSPTILQGDAGVLSKKGNSLLSSGGFSSSQNVIPPILQEIAVKEEEENFNTLQEELDLKDIDELKGIKTEVTERGFVINMMGNIFFESSTSELKPQSKEIIKQIGLLLKEKFPYNIIRVEGHTDSDPINSKTFPSNWELSAFRAASVVRYFTDTIGIRKDRFVTVGYADSRPVASNETSKGKKANRRVEIIILRSKLLGSELTTYQFQKERMERLKEIEKKEKERKEKEKNMSEAARKLMQKSKEKNSSIVISEDDYEEELKKINEKLENYEKDTDPKKKRKLFFNSVKKELQNKRNIKE